MVVLPCILMSGFAPRASSATKTSHFSIVGGGGREGEGRDVPREVRGRHRTTTLMLPPPSSDMAYKGHGQSQSSSLSERRVRPGRNGNHSRLNPRAHAPRRLLGLWSWTGIGVQRKKLRWRCGEDCGKRQNKGWRCRRNRRAGILRRSCSGPISVNKVQAHAGANHVDASRALLFLRSCVAVLRLSKRQCYILLRTFLK